MLKGLLGGFVGKIIAALLGLAGIAGVGTGLGAVGSGHATGPITLPAQVAQAITSQGPASVDVNASTPVANAAAEVEKHDSSTGASVGASTSADPTAVAAKVMPAVPQISQAAIDAAKACVDQYKPQILALISSAKAVTSRDALLPIFQQAKTVAGEARTCIEKALGIAHQAAPGVDTDGTVNKAEGIVGVLTGILHGGLSGLPGLPGGSGSGTGSIGGLGAGQLTGIIGSILNQSNMGGGVTGLPGLSTLLGQLGQFSGGAGGSFQTPFGSGGFSAGGSGSGFNAGAYATTHHYSGHHGG